MKKNTKTSDLTYSKQGLFTAFFPKTDQGVEAWRAIAEKTEGTGKVFTRHLPSALKQLRAAGYIVTAEPKLAEKAKGKVWSEIDALLTELAS